MGWYTKACKFQGNGHYVYFFDTPFLVASRLYGYRDAYCFKGFASVEICVNL